jgi:lysophospholipase L1-like esterase
MRPRSYVENLLLRKLDEYLLKSLDENINYVQGFSEKDISGKYIFLKDKIHLNEYGHSFYANMLYKKISSFIS